MSSLEEEPWWAKVGWLFACFMAGVLAVLVWWSIA